LSAISTTTNTNHHTTAPNTQKKLRTGYRKEGESKKKTMTTGNIARGGGRGMAVIGPNSVRCSLPYYLMLRTGMTTPRHTQTKKREQMAKTQTERRGENMG
jgi:hypothetical protein